MVDPAGARVRRWARKARPWTRATAILPGVCRLVREGERGSPMNEREGRGGGVGGRARAQRKSEKGWLGRWIPLDRGGRGRPNLSACLAVWLSGCLAVIHPRRRAVGAFALQGRLQGRDDDGSASTCMLGRLSTLPRSLAALLHCCLAWPSVCCAPQLYCLSAGWTARVLLLLLSCPKRDRRDACGPGRESGAVLHPCTLTGGFTQTFAFAPLCLEIDLVRNFLNSL